MCHAAWCHERTAGQVMRRVQTGQIAHETVCHLQNSPSFGLTRPGTRSAAVCALGLTLVALVCAPKACAINAGQALWLYTHGNGCVLYGSRLPAQLRLDTLIDSGSARLCPTAVSHSCASWLWHTAVDVATDDLTQHSFQAVCLNCWCSCAALPAFLMHESWLSPSVLRQLHYQQLMCSLSVFVRAHHQTITWMLTPSKVEASSLQACMPNMYLHVSLFEACNGLHMGKCLRKGNDTWLRESIWACYHCVLIENFEWTCQYNQCILQSACHRVDVACWLWLLIVKH